MNNEYYGAPTTPNDDYLAHYGVKGMKWGVRKAIASGNDRRLSRQFRKDMRKLQKLERQAANGKKYVRRAAAMGAGAAAAGGLAALGTSGVAGIMRRGGIAIGDTMAKTSKATDRISDAMIARGIRGAGVVRRAGQAVSKAGKPFKTNALRTQLAVDQWGKRANGRITNAADRLGLLQREPTGANSYAVKGISNNTVARVGAGALGAGLAAGAGYNAYRAATTKKAAAKAANWRKEMQKSYSGTRYANLPRNNGKRRRG